MNTRTGLVSRTLPVHLMEGALKKNKMASSGDNQNTLGGNFSIDDAFESDEEDPIRVYGATTDRTPFREKRRPDDVKVEVEEHNEQVSNFCFESESSWSKFISDE